MELTLKAREYCIGLGLAKPGRGKLSKDAHAAIKKAIANGQTFDDYNEKVVRNVNVDSSDNIAVNRTDSTVSNKENYQAGTTTERIAIESRQVTHDYSTIYGIDIRGRSPIVIAFQYCSKCAVQVKYCTHDTPELPEWIGGGPGFTEHPDETTVSSIYKTAQEQQ